MRYTPHRAGLDALAGAGDRFRSLGAGVRDGSRLDAPPVFRVIVPRPASAGPGAVDTVLVPDHTRGRDGVGEDHSLLLPVTTLPTHPARARAAAPLDGTPHRHPNPSPHSCGYPHRSGSGSGFPHASAPTSETEPAVTAPARAGVGAGVAETDAPEVRSGADPR